MPTLTTRPTFSLVPRGSDLEHVFPHTLDPSAIAQAPMTEADTPVDQHTWLLDFTHGGKLPGVVMSQSRMRDIELVVNPLSSMDQLTNGFLAFGRSWVDLLLNPGNRISPERYTALYRSPTGVHPPLQLRLAAPEEPGFLLQKVPVHSMKEVWGILEVVREQSWLNNVLLACHWTTEGLTMEADELPQVEDDTTTEAELEAILNGTFPPRKIPVNVFLPSSAPDPLFDSPETVQNRRPKIIMTVPEHPPMSGLVTITVSYNETRPRGIGIQIAGAMGADLNTDNLEEICRRGGTLSLPGRIWAKAQHS